MKRKKDNKVIAICGVSLVVLGVGYFMVENLSKREKPPLGMTFNIIVGFLLISIAVIVLAVTLKNHFFPKKRKKKSRPVFLNETMAKKHEEK